MLGKAGGVFFLTADKVQTNEAVLLAAAARAVLGGDRGSLTEQIDHRATGTELFLRRHSLRLQSRQSLSRNAPDGLKD